MTDTAPRRHRGSSPSPVPGGWGPTRCRGEGQPPGAGGERPDRAPGPPSCSARWRPIATPAWWARCSPGEAARFVSRDHPDVVSLDMTGLEGNGQAAGLVREILGLAPVPILLLVPSDQRRDASMAAVRRRRRGGHDLPAQVGRLGRRRPAPAADGPRPPLDAAAAIGSGASVRDPAPMARMRTGASSTGWWAWPPPREGRPRWPGCWPASGACNDRWWSSSTCSPASSTASSVG